MVIEIRLHYREEISSSTNTYDHLSHTLIKRLLQAQKTILRQ